VLPTTLCNPHGFYRVGSVKKRWIQSVDRFCNNEIQKSSKPRRLSLHTSSLYTGKAHIIQWRRHVSHCYLNSVTGNGMGVFRKHTSCVMAQAEARDRSRASPYGIYSGQIFSEYFRFAIVSTIPLLLHTNISLTYQRRYMILTSDSRVTTQKSDDIIYTGESLWLSKLRASLHSHPQKRANVPSDVPQSMDLLTFFSEDNPTDW